MMYYGVWINIDNDTRIGTQMFERSERVGEELLANGPPGEGDNLLIFSGLTGRLFASFDVDRQEWQAE